MYESFGIEGNILLDDVVMNTDGAYCGAVLCMCPFI